MDEHNCIYYVYEKGKLTIGGQKQNKYQKPNIDNTTIQTCQVNRGKLASTLQEICIEFVSVNLHLVESFVDFPDVVGKAIFKSAMVKGIFDRHDTTSLHALALFTSAYCQDVLSGLELTQAHLSIGHYLDHIVLFRDLQKLTLAGCKLGDDHELISHIATLKRLTHLNLSDNALTDNGIRKLTARMRMFQDSLMDLKILILSDNPSIQNTAIKYLTNQNTCLEELDMSGTGITAEGIKKIEQETSLRQVLDCDNLSTQGQLETEGWASPVIQAWLERTKHSKPTVTASKSHFYSRAKIKAAMGKEVSDTFVKKQPQGSTVTIYFKADLTIPKQSSTASLKKPDSLKQHRPKAMPLKSNNNANALPIAVDLTTKKCEPSKTGQNFNMSEEDLALLQTYMGCKRPSDKSKSGSLWENI